MDGAWQGRGGEENGEGRSGDDGGGRVGKRIRKKGRRERKEVGEGGGKKCESRRGGSRRGGLREEREGRGKRRWRSQQSRVKWREGSEGDSRESIER